MNLGGHEGARKEKQKSQRKKKGKKRKKREKKKKKRCPRPGAEKDRPYPGALCKSKPPSQVADRKHWLPFKLARCRSLAGGLFL